MGRKQAPQPLSLAESQSHAHAGSGPNSSSNGSTTISPNALTSSAPDFSALGTQGPRSPRGTGTTGETNLHIIPTPTSSRSPRSPRSPFSKFNTSKKPEPRQANTPHAQSPSQLQSKFSSQQAPEYPQFDYKAGPVAESYDQEYYHYPPDPPRTNPSELQQNKQPTHEQKLLTSSRSHTNPASGPTTPTLREGVGAYDGAVQRPPPPLPPREAGREEEKHSRSASRFFNFKSSKPPQHRREQTRDHRQNREHSQNSRSNDENASSEVMSRGAEQHLTSDRVSTKTSKYSGMFARVTKDPDPQCRHSSRIIHTCVALHSVAHE